MKKKKKESPDFRSPEVGISANVFFSLEKQELEKASFEK